MPTSFVVQMSSAGPQIMAPVSLPPPKRSFRYCERSARVAVKTSALASSHWPKEAMSRWQTSTMFMMRLPRYARSRPAMLAPTTRPCSWAVGSMAWASGDITRRVDRLHARAEVIIDEDAAAGLRRHLDAGAVEPLEIGADARGHDDDVGEDGRALLEGELSLALPLLDLG